MHKGVHKSLEKSKLKLKWLVMNTFLMDKIKKTELTECCSVCVGTETCMHCWWQCKMAHSLWKIFEKAFKWLIIHLPHDPTISVLCIYPREMKVYGLTNTWTWIFLTAIFAIAQNWKQIFINSLKDK